MWFLQMAQLSTTMSHDQSVTAFHFLISSRFFFAPPSSLFKAAALASSIFTSAMATAPYTSCPSRASLHLTTGVALAPLGLAPFKPARPLVAPSPLFLEGTPVSSSNKRSDHPIRIEGMATSWPPDGERETEMDWSEGGRTQGWRATRTL